MDEARPRNRKHLNSLSRRFSGALLVLSLIIGANLAHAETHPGEAALVSEVAKETGKDPQALTALLDGAKMQQSIIDAMNRPAEGKPWKDYRPIFITESRIAAGAAFYNKNRELIERIGKKYGVAPEYIVAIVGVETFWGKNTGKYKVLDALVTLAFYYPKRAPFFREQLKALLILPDNHLAGPLDTLTGSYAGAQGWGQFMPSSIRDYGVDEDGDGHIDMKNSLPDILGSVANYFAGYGWEKGGPVAATAQPDAKALSPDDLKTKEGVTESTAIYVPRWPVEQLVAWGYAPLQHLDPGRNATLVQLQGELGPEYWFTFQNFYVITRYNRSPMYAMAVKQLAEAIKSRADASQ
jgi:membrane-bound lytic murein transglycosylase B